MRLCAAGFLKGPVNRGPLAMLRDGHIRFGVSQTLSHISRHKPRLPVEHDRLDRVGLEDVACHRESPTGACRGSVRLVGPHDQLGQAGRADNDFACLADGRILRSRELVKQTSTAPTSAHHWLRHFPSVLTTDANDPAFVAHIWLTSGSKDCSGVMGSNPSGSAGHRPLGQPHGS